MASRAFHLSVTANAATPTVHWEKLSVSRESDFQLNNVQRLQRNHDWKCRNSEQMPYEYRTKGNMRLLWKFNHPKRGWLSCFRNGALGASDLEKNCRNYVQVLRVPDVNPKIHLPHSWDGKLHRWPKPQFPAGRPGTPALCSFVTKQWNRKLLSYKTCFREIFGNSNALWLSLWILFVLSLFWISVVCGCGCADAESREVIRGPELEIQEAMNHRMLALGIKHQLQHLNFSKPFSFT